MSAQWRIDVISLLDKQTQTLNLSPIRCKMDGVLAWETDSSLCGDGDESPQDSTKSEREGGRLETKNSKKTSAEIKPDIEKNVH